MKLLKMDKTELSELLSLFVPIFIEQFFISTVGLIITAIVKISGMEAVAAVSLLNSLIMLFQQSFSSLGVGVSVVVAQLRGRGDPKATGTAASQSLTLALITSVSVSLMCYIFMEPLMSAVFQNSDPLVYEYGRTYMFYNVLSLPLISVYTITSAAIRGSGYPRASLAATFVYNSAYVVMAYVSVAFMHMGLTGISVSLMASRLIAAVLGIVLMLRGNENMQVKGLTVRINRSVAKPVFRVAIPLLLENLLFSGGRLVTQSFSVVYGTNSVAANGIANTIHGFMLVPGVASSNVALPLVGRYCGQGDNVGAKRKGYQILFINIIMLIISSAATLIFLKPLVGSMTPIPDVASQTYTVVISYCIMAPVFWTLGFVTPSILRSSGDGKFTSIICILAMLLMRITTGYILTIVLRIGIIGIWISMYADWLFRVIFFVPRLRNEKWFKKTILD